MALCLLITNSGHRNNSKINSHQIQTNGYLYIIGTGGGVFGAAMLSLTHSTNRKKEKNTILFNLSKFQKTKKAFSILLSF